MERLEQLLDYLIELAGDKEIEDIDYNPFNKEYEIKLKTNESRV